MAAAENHAILAVIREDLKEEINSKHTSPISALRASTQTYSTEKLWIIDYIWMNFLQLRMIFQKHISDNKYLILKIEYCTSSINCHSQIVVQLPEKSTENIFHLRGYWWHGSNRQIQTPATKNSSTSPRVPIGFGSRAQVPRFRGLVHRSMKGFWVLVFLKLDGLAPNPWCWVLG